MAYTMSTQEFFAGPMAHILATPTPLKEIGGVIYFAIEGEAGGDWSVDLDRGEVHERKLDQPNVIIRAQELDFMALVEGRMSVSDGLLTDRLQVTGDMSRLTRLFQAIASLELS